MMDAAPLAAALAIFAAGTWLTREAGTDGVMPPAPNVGLANVRTNALSYLWQLASAYPIALIWLAVSGRIRQVALVAALCAPAVLLQGWRTLPGAVVGAICVIALAAKAWKSKDPSDPALAAWLLVPLPVLGYVHFPPKYLLAAAPAIAILAVKLIRDSGRWEHPLWRAALAASLALSLAMLRADAVFASLPRRAAADLIAPPVKAGERVWYAGQWGLYWYAKEAGARHVLPQGPQPAPGDLLVLGKVEGCRELLDRYPRRTLVERRIYPYTGGRTMDLATRAGLHSNLWGPFLWTWGRGELNRYEVWRLD